MHLIRLSYCRHTSLAVGAVGGVKQEKKTGGIGNKENIEEEAVDDPSPAPAAKPAKVKRGAQSQFYHRQGVQPPVQASGCAF